MRRKDREMNVAFAYELIDKAMYGTLAVLDTEGSPYALPLSIVRNEQMLYFHSAKAGKKVEAFKQQKLVCVSFVGEVKVPDLYTDKELETLLVDSAKSAVLTSKVFTTMYESAMVRGVIQEVRVVEEQLFALRLICEKYTPEKMSYFDSAAQSGLARTNIYRIAIQEITAKRKKFDSSGEEMKWGRME